MYKSTLLLGRFLGIWGMFAVSQVAVCQIQPPLTPASGTEPVYAYVHATIYESPEKVWQDATLLIQGSRILEVFTRGTPPADAVVVDCSGKFIYPSFIDPYSSYGMPKSEKRASLGPQPLSKRVGAYYWNQAIKPDISYAAEFQYSVEKADDLRASGFGWTSSQALDGIVRGKSVLLAITDDAAKQIIKPESALTFSFDKGSSTQDYPSSQTGAIALLRQFYYDVDWYADFKKEAPEQLQKDLSLEAMLSFDPPCLIFDARNQLEVFRAAQLADELEISWIYKTGGDDYKNLNELADLDAELILPLNYPAAFDFKNPHEVDMVSLNELYRWKWAPFNARLLDSLEIRFAFTAQGTKGKLEFLGQLRKTVLAGLDSSVALAALTTVPAQMLGIEDFAGTLEAGKSASFFICSGDFFARDSKVETHVVLGKPFQIEPAGKQREFRGIYQLNLPAEVLLDGKKLTVSGRESANTGYLELTEQTKLSVRFQEADNFLQGQVNLPGLGGFVWLTLYPAADSSYTVKVLTAEGRQLEGTAWQMESFQPDTGYISNTEYVWELPERTYFPLMAYGWDTLPEAEDVLVRNATIWTSGPLGKLDSSDIWIQNGKIKAIGRGLKGGNRTQVIQGDGLHVSPGLIDEHSHIALSGGVNESGQASSAEVRMADVINPYDINIYRQLAGGVTTSQLLHGSANPIGGQSALIRLKWGESATGMLFPNAPGFIKFALGENVKQSNWGDRFRQRYPQSRMGVEQWFYFNFLRALDYRKKLRESDVPVRRDFEMETLLEILDGKRFITCHSYVQSEINMLMHVADSLGFTVRTFTHVLEGYKVAEQLKKHGAGASTFSDWWSYKMEVQEAIPYNAAILSGMGVVTAINSDDAEMGRRLNQEAAKSIKYGGLSEEEALKLVTLNPAKLLGIDKQVGSLEVGKDADLVIWSDNPLSMYARVKMTFIEGARYFDMERNAAMEVRDLKMKTLLIDDMMKASESGEKTIPVTRKFSSFYHCDTREDSMDNGN